MRSNPSRDGEKRKSLRAELSTKQSKRPRQAGSHIIPQSPHPPEQGNRSCSEASSKRDVNEGSNERKILEDKMVIRQGVLYPASCDFDRLLLAGKNAHPRDSLIYFDAEPHLYWSGNQVRQKERQGQSKTDLSNDGSLPRARAYDISCTGFVKHFFNKFDGQKVALNMIRRPNFLTTKKYSKYRSMLNHLSFPLDEFQEEEAVGLLVDSWEKYGNQQSGLGTVMHDSIELFYNDRQTLENLEKSTEGGFFVAYQKEFVEPRGWKPFRTEWIVYNETVCGSIDMCYSEGDVSEQQLQLWRSGGTRIDLHMVDWKRSKEIRRFGFGKHGKGPCARMPDCNFSHYTLQLNLYKHLLEQNYHVNIKSMRLAVFHPNNSTYQLYEVVDQQPTILEMFKVYLKEEICRNTRLEEL